MFYDKKIKYLDYYENGSRIKGAGYVRLEARGQSLRLELSVTALHPTDSFEREIFLCSGKEEKSVGIIRISAGRGQYQRQWPDSSNIGGTEISYAGLEGIHIPMGANREISCRWQTQKTAPATDALPRKDESLYQAPSRSDKEMAVSAGGASTDIVSPDTGSADVISADVISADVISMNKARKIRTAERELQVIQSEAPKREFQTAAEEAEPSEIPAAAKMPARSEIGATSKAQLDSPAAPVKLLEDKWEQLWAIYPHLRPFRDKREYLSLRPADFVIFSSSSYRLVNNSFLLHGYYNYKHLILARVERKGEAFYYIGVPGNFYEKEKQVAIMFGFESFECAEEPAQAGDFGYYMMRAEL